MSDMCRFVGAWGFLLLSSSSLSGNHGTAIADVFSMPPGLVSIELVSVGNPGNPGELSGEAVGGYGPTRICGAVNYHYEIGVFEVTAAQYTEFLNAVARSDPFNLWSFPGPTDGPNIMRTGTAGNYSYHVALDWANRPVNRVNWGAAARFVNWLENGQPIGPAGPGTTEDGTYELNGAMSDDALLLPARSATARYALPTEDEWYKAAYHKNNGPTGDYWKYAAQSDAIPSNDLLTPDPGNNANFNDGAGQFTIGAPYYRTTVGEFENSISAYGTFDQGGNVAEWNEEVIEGFTRGVRGAAWNGYSGVEIGAADRDFYFPSVGQDVNGFRIVRLRAGCGLLGDMNCDCVTSVADIAGFVLALTDPAAFAAQFPNCDVSLADLNQDGAPSVGDVGPFVTLLTR